MAPSQANSAYSVEQQCNFEVNSLITYYMLAYFCPVLLMSTNQILVMQN